MGLITSAEARAWVKIPAGTGDDPIIDSLVASVSADCERFVGSPIEQTDVEAYLTGDDTSVLILPMTPVISVTSLSIMGGSALVNGWDKDYVIVLRTGIIRLTGGVFPSRPGSIHAQWKAGYATVPDDLKVSIMKGVAFNLHAQDKRRQGVSSVSDSMGGQTTYITDEYPKDVTDVWKRYRVNHIG